MVFRVNCCVSSWFLGLIVVSTLIVVHSDFLIYFYTQKSFTARIVFHHFIRQLAYRWANLCAQYIQRCQSFIFQRELSIFLTFLSIFVSKFINLCISGKFCAIEVACNFHNLHIFCLNLCNYLGSLYIIHSYSHWATRFQDC